MANEAERPVTLSLLDRLIDLEPKNQEERPLKRAPSIKQLKASLKRDLDWLLNTRRTIQPAPESSTDLDHSLYNYGLPDFTGMSLRSIRDQARIAKMIETALVNFEPRLQGVRVAMEPLTDNVRSLHFKIEALLIMDPAPERISFDTVLELASGQYKVEGEAGAG